MRVDHAIGGDATPVSLHGIFHGCKLNPKERDSVGLFADFLAPIYELVGRWMFRGGIVKDHNIATRPDELALLQKLHQHHSAGPATGELDHVRQVRVRLGFVVQSEFGRYPVF